MDPQRRESPIILNHPADLRRVQVLPGTIVDGKHALEKGQVELGYEPEGTPQRCTSLALLGHLLEGQPDQEVVPQSVGHEVSCVRPVANANQVGGLSIRHIYLWEEHARDMGAAQEEDNSVRRRKLKILQLCHSSLSE